MQSRQVTAGVQAITKRVQPKPIHPSTTPLHNTVKYTSKNVASNLLKLKLPTGATLAALFTPCHHEVNQPPGPLPASTTARALNDLAG
jgi:hypothetical protein